MLSDKLRSLLPPGPKRFRAWQIDITTRCRLACQMCIRRGLPGWIEAEMGLSDFVRIVPLFDDVETVVLQGWGEPLLHRDLAPIVAAAKGRDLPSGAPRLPSGFRPPAVGFVTSGQGLDSRRCGELIDAGLDFIGFSFAGSTAAAHEAIRANSEFRELTDAVRSIAEIKKARGTELPRMHIVFLLLKDNLGDLASLPNLARDLGVNRIVLTNLVHVTTDWQDGQKVFACGGPTRAADIVAGAAASAHALGIQITLPALSPRTVAVCEEDPLHTLYLSQHGEVSPCVYLHPPAGSPFTRIFCGRAHQAERLSFGNVLQEPFEGIWEREEYVAFREEMAVRGRGRWPLSSLIRALGTRGRDQGGPPMPEPPLPCRTCHKMLGL